MPKVIIGDIGVEEKVMLKELEVRKKAWENEKMKSGNDCPYCMRNNVPDQGHKIQ